MAPTLPLLVVITLGGIAEVIDVSGNINSESSCIIKIRSKSTLRKF